MYKKRSNICLGIAGLILSSVFVYGLFTSIYSGTTHMRMILICVGMAFLGLSMYFTENENV